MSVAGVMDKLPPGFLSPAAFAFFTPAPTGAQAVPVPAPVPSIALPPGFLSPAAFVFAPRALVRGESMTAPAGTLAYRTYVTLSAAGNSNGDAKAD